MAVRLTQRDGLISDIRHLDSPPTIEILHVADCPHHQAFLPHLRDLLVTVIPLDTARQRREQGKQGKWNKVRSQRKAILFLSLWCPPRECQRMGTGLT